MTSTPGAVGTAASLRVTLSGAVYVAGQIARGAAYELFSPVEEQGFTPCPNGWHRFVHASEVSVVPGGATSDETLDRPLLVPLSRTGGWRDVHRLTQTPSLGHPAEVAAIRRTAVTRRAPRWCGCCRPSRSAPASTGPGLPRRS